MSADDDALLATRIDRARGLMLGLLLGDSVDEWDRDDPWPNDGLMHGSCLSQLACFTLEGLIRAHEREIHRGICSIEGTIWHAWCRWAHIQGLGPGFADRWQGGNAAAGWPDGWLHQIGPLTVRRGTAPATVAALREHPGVPGDDFSADGNSAGHHALTRILPLAILLGESGPRVAETLARFTHGSPAAWKAAATGVTIVAATLSSKSQSSPSSPTAFSNDPPGTAGHALWHGWRAAGDATTFDSVVRAARRHGRGAAIVAGALSGARLGAGALDEGLIRRHEIAWVADQLARDAIRDVTERPAGDEYSPAPDPAWSARYPGW